MRRWKLKVVYSLAACCIFLAQSQIACRAGTYEVASKELYRAIGMGRPVLGYKLSAASNANFLACDGTPLNVAEKNLIRSAGNCGDAKKGVTIFSVNSQHDGVSSVRVFASNVQDLAGTNASITTNELRETFAKTHSSPDEMHLFGAEGSRTFVTNNTAAMVGIFGH